MILIPESALIKGQLTGIYTIGNGNVIWMRTGKTLAIK
jgi:hypothetical protein